MSTTTAPKPPTKRLLAAACVTGGTALGMLVLMSTGHFIFGNIPPNRLLWYSLAILVMVCTSGTLAARYLVQKHRRDAWWDGFAAGDEPLAEVIPLRDLKGYNGSNAKFINGSPS